MTLSFVLISIAIAPCGNISMVILSPLIYVIDGFGLHIIDGLVYTNIEKPVSFIVYCLGSCLNTFIVSVLSIPMCIILHWWSYMHPRLAMITRLHIIMPVNTDIHAILTRCFSVSDAIDMLMDQYQALPVEDHWVRRGKRHYKLTRMTTLH